MYSFLFLVMGKVKESCFLSACRQGICFVPVIWFLPGILGMNCPAAKLRGSSLSLKSNGVRMLNDCLSHTVQTIAIFTRHQVGTVVRALKIFQKFWLVEILTDGAYYMSGIQLLIGQSPSEREWKNRERMRLKKRCSRRKKR